MRIFKSRRNVVTKAKIKLAVVFGTRPEAIKLAPVLRQLSSDPRFQPVSIVTAQHRQMLDQVLDAFDIRPEHDLGIMRPNQTLAAIVSQSMDALICSSRRFVPMGYWFRVTHRRRS